jgi:hypothetical protein
VNAQDRTPDIRQEWLQSAIYALDHCDPRDVEALCRGIIGDKAPSWPIRPLFAPGADERLAKDACDAIFRCHRDIAVQIAETVLDMLRSGGPRHDLMGDLRMEAESWADIAGAQEVRAYVIAGLNNLAGRAISDKARKEVFAALWKGMAEKDRTAFLTAVGAANG